MLQREVTMLWTVTVVVRHVTGGRSRIPHGEAAMDKMQTGWHGRAGATARGRRAGGAYAVCKL